MDMTRIPFDFDAFAASLLSEVPVIVPLNDLPLIEAPFIEPACAQLAATRPKVKIVTFNMFTPSGGVLLDAFSLLWQAPPNQSDPLSHHELVCNVESEGNLRQRSRKMKFMMAPAQRGKHYVDPVIHRKRIKRVGALNKPARRLFIAIVIE